MWVGGPSGTFVRNKGAVQAQPWRVMLAWLPDPPFHNFRTRQPSATPETRWRLAHRLEKPPRLGSRNRGRIRLEPKRRRRDRMEEVMRTGFIVPQTRLKTTPPLPTRSRSILPSRLILSKRRETNQLSRIPLKALATRQLR